MSKKFEGSVAPRERINISYVPKTDGQTAEVELPLNMLVVGDTGNTQETSSLDERQAVSVKEGANKQVISSQVDSLIKI
ncbi:type VI secretion system contractile sheath small subunit, partial [Escherichia coli]|uniref:type VI secretion system contractile sheath small subunit n=1 Tax=Escherichia coli TaxID=562 RepID=UPI000FF10172